jgi:hypothetical protein
MYAFLKKYFYRGSLAVLLCSILLELCSSESAKSNTDHATLIVMPTENDDIEIRYILEQNTALLKENNLLLKKMYRNAVWGFWFRIVWYLMLVGLPFALYFYILEPYFTALGSSYQTFSAGMQEIPGWKQFMNTLDAVKASRQ